MEITAKDETEQIRNLASRVAGLPALPMIASRLLEAVDDPQTSAAEMAALISSDPALATRLLKLANSAFYGFPRRIGTVNLAVVVLGFETVRDLCLSVLITDCFFQSTEDIPFDMEDFWRHSLATAVGARMVYRICDAKHAGEGFIAGLVHDLGKLFFGRYFPDDYREVINRFQDDGLALLEAEKEVFSVTHPVAGAWLLEEWNLPVWLVNAVRNHHKSDGGEEKSRLAQAVCFSDILVRKANLGGGCSGVNVAVTPELMDSLKLKKNVYCEPDYEDYIENLQQELKLAEGFLETLKKAS